MRWYWLIILAAMPSFTACTPVISSEVRSGLQPNLSFADIMADPQAHIGASVMLSGTIIKAQNLHQGTRLEILQFPATRRGRPKTDEPSGGRFLVMSPDYLETAVYRPGRAITVAGRITRVRELPLGETVYTYPQLEPYEVHLWREGDGFPQLHIGFGFGFSKGF